MPVSVVVGGQFGSEGKGKVALDIARRKKAAAVVRTGGTNSGHTGTAADGTLKALRQLPAAALADDSLVILPPGALVDIGIFAEEVRLLGLGPDRVKVDKMATVISGDDIEAELGSGLVAAIGSTGSGTGAALQRRISRLDDASSVLASGHPELEPYFCDTLHLMREILDRGELIVIEGTQGFGLSLLHGGFYPKATSRDTTAGAFVAEAGLSPTDVSDVVLVLRTYPIRVAGDSGPLKGETTWAEIAASADLPADYCELTTATKKIRRVGSFDPDLVRRAITVNNPTEIVLNHMDYIDPTARSDTSAARANEFIEQVERNIGRSIFWVGTGPDSVVPRAEFKSLGESSNLESRRKLEVATPAIL